MSSRGANTSLFGAVDKLALGLYIAIVLIGVMCITSASYEPESANIFSLSHNYMKQIMWLAISSVVATVVLLLDRRLFHMFAYPVYIVGILMLLGALFFGREVNGAKAWFEFGSVRIQPVEFVKIATALMMARPYQGGGGDYPAIWYHRVAERYGFGIGAWCVPLCALS